LFVLNSWLKITCRRSPSLKLYRSKGAVAALIANNLCRFVQHELFKQPLYASVQMSNSSTFSRCITPVVSDYSSYQRAISSSAFFQFCLLRLPTDTCPVLYYW